MVIVFFLYFLYATVFVIGKFALDVCQPIFLTGVRMVVAGILSYMIHCSLHGVPNFRKIGQKEWWVIIALGIFNVYVTNGGEFWSLQYLSSGKVSFLYNFTPFFTLIFSAWIFVEKITLRKIIGIVIGFISLVPILQQDPELIDTTCHYGCLSMAEVVMLCAAIAAAIGSVFMKHLIHKSFTPFFLNGMSMTLGGLLCIIHALLFEARPFVKSGYLGSFMGYMLLIMFIQNLFAYNLHSYLLRYYTATLIAFFSFVMPLMTVVMGYIFLQEAITTMFFVCSGGVALGLFIFYQEELRILQ